MRRVLTVGVAAAALCFSQLSASTAVAPVGAAVQTPHAAVAAKAGKTLVPTKFALDGAAYGTRVQGGSLPANSSDTAFQQIGCTNRAGYDRNNFEADQIIPGLGKAEGVRTRVWTTKSGGTVSSNSQHKIARLILAQTSLGSLEIQGISSTSRAFNNNGKFGASITNEVARIVLKPVGAPAQTLAIPAPGRTLTIPGLATISIGKSVRKVTAGFASQAGNVLDIKVLPLGTRARVAQTRASIAGGIRQGVFRGYSAGVEARGLGDNLKIGRTPLTIMPCQGTKAKGKNVAGVGLGDVGNLRGVASGQVAVNRDNVATGTEVGRVVNASLLDGRVKLEGIVGVANVKRDRGTITRNSNGSTVARVTINGRRYSFPKFGVIEIPGLVKLQERIVQRTKFGLKVIGLRVTVLDGSGAVVDLGVAQLGIRAGAPTK